MNSFFKILLFLSCLLLWEACSEVTPPPRVVSAGASPVAETSSPISLPELRSGDMHLAAVGDIADCRVNGGAAAKATATLLAKFPGVTVVAPGDLAYRNATRRELAECYDSTTTWGTLKERTRPAPGNHDYGIYAPAHRNNAVPYFEYFGEIAAGPAGKGFYSFDLGSWHIVSLNSMAGEVRSAPTMTEQVRWLRDDLAAAGKPCILAFWHHPLFSSGEHGHDNSDPGRQTKPLWQVLSEHGADLIVNGHDHHYERFALQTSEGEADPDRGIREFVVGTGGADLRRIEGRQDNSEKYLDNNASDHGVLFLTLRTETTGGYEWKFIRTNGTTGDESDGLQACHSKSVPR